jgi:hypothetical protein
LWEPADIVSDGTVKWQREDDSVYLLELLGRTPMRYGVSATDPSVYWTPLHTYRNGDVMSWTPKMRQLAKVEPCP